MECAWPAPRYWESDMITPLAVSDIIAATDKIAAAYIAELGTYASGLGEGDGTLILASDWGVSRKLRELQLLVAAYCFVLNNQTCGNPVQNAINVSGITNISKGKFLFILMAYNNAAAISGNALALPTIQNLPTYLTYYNTGAGGPYTCLVAPEFSTLWNLCFGTIPGQPAGVGALNVYSPLIATMATQVVGGAFTPGTNVDTTQYAGAGQIEASITGATWSSGSSGTVTITANAIDASGAAQTGRTFSGTLSTVAGSGSVVLTPAIAGDLATAITAVTTPGTLTAGTIVVSSLYPAGRSAPT